MASTSTLVHTTTMAVLFLAIALATATAGVASAMDFTEHDLASDESMWALYERWFAHYKQVGRDDLGDKARRFDVFKKNARFIHQFNQGGASYNLSLNLFADMTGDETRRAYRCSAGVPPPLNRTTRFDDAVVPEQNLPPAVDWRVMGFDGRPAAVTGVKNQGPGCGSCWAFAVAASVEGINAIRTRDLVPVSEQQILDCDTGNGGCSGGVINTAFDFIVRNGGVAHERAYPPYRASKGFCVRVPGPVVTINGYAPVMPPNDVAAMMRAVAAQPVVVQVLGADGEPFKRYGGGVFQGPCERGQYWHAMTLVGYGTTQFGENYWILKNSWGPAWGEQGYIRMRRDVPNREGLCSILMYAAYPLKH